jgi:hypothetical protein
VNGGGGKFCKGKIRDLLQARITLKKKRDGF